MSQEEKVRERGWQILQWIAVTAALLLPVLENFSPEVASSSPSPGVVPAAVRAIGTVSPTTMSSEVLRIAGLEPLEGESRLREYFVEDRQLRFEFRGGREPASVGWVLERVERVGLGEESRVEEIELYTVDGGRERHSAFLEIFEGRNRFRAVYRSPRGSEIRRVPFEVVRLKKNS